MADMDRNRARYLVDVLLLVSLLVVGVTGIVVDRLELHDFVLHRWAGYALAVLAAMHIAMHWRWLVPVHRASKTAAPMTTDSATDTAVKVSAASGPERVGTSRRSVLAVAGAAVGGAAVGWLGKGAITPVPYDGDDVGLFYHRQSSLGVRSLTRSLLGWGRQPEPYKTLPGTERTLLPAVTEPPNMPFVDALRHRRSRRDFDERALTTDELAWVVHAATSITSNDGRRVAPSAGALYPIETYVAARQVEGVEPGLYHVDVRGQALELVRPGSVAGDLMVAGLGQDFLREAPVVLVLSGVFQRTRWKYHERHYRYICWEGGHITQNVYLAAEAAGLAACMVGSFLDGSVNDLLRVDGRAEAALGLIAVGAMTAPPESESAGTFAPAPVAAP